jgi:hypothetical protein
MTDLRRRMQGTYSLERLDMRSGQGTFRLRDDEKVLPTAGWMILLVAYAVANSQNVLAQSSNDVDGAVRVGDRWVYETRDEMTGFPKEIYTEIVTEVSPENAIVNLTFSGSAVSVFVTYDREWNCIDNLIWKYKPGNGQGMKLPLAVGKAWETTFDASNTQTGANFKGSSSSTVVAQEKITTPAGSFDTFKIEQRVREIDAANPSKLTESQIVVWYAPQINHFVRRTILVKFAERTRATRSEELAEFTRKL